MASSSNQPNLLRAVPVFTENPWVRVINLLPTVVIAPPVTVELWFSGVNQPDIVPSLSVVGQTITVGLTVAQNRLLPAKGASINVKFAGSYVIQQELTPTKKGAIPEDVVEEYDTPGLGVFRVSYFSDLTNAKMAADSTQLALEYAERAEKAATSAQTLYYAWNGGVWNVATNTPPLPANPTTVVVGGKYPQVVITVGGNLPISTVEGYALNQHIDPGFLYGQPNGKWAYQAPDSLSLQFQKNHAKFNIGPSEAFDVTQNNIDVTFEVLSTATVFDENNGYRLIQPASITVGNNQILVLSASPSSYVSPDLRTAGNGEQLYLRAISFLAQPALDGQAQIGSVQQFRWSPMFPSLNTREFEKSSAIFSIGPPDNISITVGATQTVVTISAAGCTVRDNWTGYRSLGAQTITLDNHETLVLSSASGSYQDPQLYKRGNGESLYLQKYGLLAYNRPPKGSAILGNVTAFKWTPSHPSLMDRTDVNSLKTRATNLETFQKVRPEAYIGPKSNIKIASVDGGTSYKIDILATVAIRDEKSGYGSIPVQSITLTNNQVLCLAKNVYPGAYVDPGLDVQNAGTTVNLYKYALLALTNKYPGTIVLGMVINGVWIGLHPSFVGDYIDRITDLRQKGLLPQMSTARNVHRAKTPRLAEWVSLKDRDYVILCLNGSIYDNRYASKRPNPEYRGPRSDDYGVMSYLEDELMKTVPGQKFRGIGAKTEPGGSTDVFTETATTATTKEYDNDWDLVYSTPPTQTAQAIKTRVLEGAAVSLAYWFRNGEESLHFVSRTGSLNSGAVRITIEGGNGFVQVLDEIDDTWKDANNFLWTKHKAPATVHPGWGAATGLKESIAQHRLKFRRNPANADRLNRTITMAAEDGGRICYHGISYSVLRHQLIFINDSKGSHDQTALKKYPWRDAHYKAHSIFFGANTINMLSFYTSGYNPNSFAQDFVDYVNFLKSPSYTHTQIGTNGYVDGPFNPEVVMMVDFCSRTQALYATDDKTPANTFTGYGPATLMDFITKMIYRVENECNIAVSNAFPLHMEVVAKYAAFTGDTKYRAAHEYAGATSASQTTDTTHLNDKGAATSAAKHIEVVNIG